MLAGFAGRSGLNGALEDWPPVPRGLAKPGKFV